MNIFECNNILRRSNFEWNGSRITSTGRWYLSKAILNLIENNPKSSSKEKRICNLEDKRQNTKKQVEKKNGQYPNCLIPKTSNYMEERSSRSESRKIKMKNQGKMV
ncbi:hypothetical protein JTB14_021823 [Gonioctena quinquepunctata]|nr:hypothetical protein JTB14_021823 [Gonioctena quinquepunctata]